MFNKIFCFFLITLTVAKINAQSIDGSSLLPADSLLFKTSIAGENSSDIQLISINGQSFQKAYHISTVNQSGNGYSLKCPIKEAVQKGDVLLFSFYSRTISSRRETGLAFFEARLNHYINGKNTWPPLLERGMSFGSEWVFTQIPFKAAKDINSGDLAFDLNCGAEQQVLEIGGVSLVNYKQSVALNSLPKSTVHYDGDEPDAAWRKTAEERIEKFRKGDLLIKVLDKKGKPVQGATVAVQMKSSAFAWGVATSSQLILNSENANATIYRDTLLRYFNKVVLENEMKSKNWQRFNTKQTKAGVDWFDKHQIPVRGHVMVWPSWRHSPHLVKYKEDTAALRKIILQQIQEQAAAMKGRFTEWDVINEPYAHHNIIDALGGKSVMLDWFAAARKNAPGVKLFLNDYTMFHEKDMGSESFFNTIKYLVDNKAPLDAIGEQAHIGGTPPSINYVLERLDRFSVFGLPIQISEFDITSDDDDFKARYMNDFMTAIFSHPSANGFMQWGFWESAHWMPAGALWDKDWNLRPQGKVFTELVSKTWRTNENGLTGKDGIYSIRGFNGDYEITVTYKEKKILKNCSLDKKGKSITVKF